MYYVDDFKAGFKREDLRFLLQLWDQICVGEMKGWMHLAIGTKCQAVLKFGADSMNLHYKFFFSYSSISDMRGSTTFMLFFASVL